MNPATARRYLNDIRAVIILGIFAVDADTGKACAGFGKDGILDVNAWNTTNDKWPLSILQPPTVYRNELIIG
jgi:quinoprotein glucose dehydrogenase